MNPYLEEKTGVTKVKEELIEYRKIIESIKRSIDQKESLIREYSIFNKSIINFIKEMTEEFYNLNYRLVKLPIPNPSSKKTKKQKYKYLLISELLENIPEYNSDEYWRHLENGNIVIIGTTRPIENTKIIQSISFYNKDANRDDTIDFYRTTTTEENSIYFKITEFMNIIILNRYENNIKKTSLEDIKKLYNDYNKSIKCKQLNSIK